MADKLTGWVQFTGSDEQIADLSNAQNGFICKNNYGHIWDDIYIDWSKCPIGATHYWIIPSDPLREMKIRQSQTGQPVWWRFSGTSFEPGVRCTTSPDWNIPNAEYSFAPFED